MVHIRKVYTSIKKVMIINSLNRLSILLKNLAITDLLSGLLWAILLWLGFVCTTLLQPILWENKSPKLFFLNSFHKLVEIIFITLILVSF